MAVGQSNGLRSRSLGPRSMSDAEQPRSGSSEKQLSQMKTGGRVAIFCFLGIFISYFVYGLLQEKM